MFLVVAFLVFQQIADAASGQRIMDPLSRYRLALVTFAVLVALAIPVLALTIAMFYTLPIAASAAIVAAAFVATVYAFRFFRKRKAKTSID